MDIDCFVDLQGVMYETERLPWGAALAFNTSTTIPAEQPCSNGNSNGKAVKLAASSASSAIVE